MADKRNRSWVLASSSQFNNASDNLKLIESAIPEPGTGQVLIRVAYVSLNYRDILVATNNPMYPAAHQPSLVPTADASGTIHSAGPQSTWSGKEGTRIAVQSAWDTFDVRDFDLTSMLGAGNRNGTLSRFVVLPDELVTAIPKEIDLKDAACLYVAGLTAMNALLYGPEIGKPTKGRTILTQGTGGISTAGIQIASSLGATVIATSSKEQGLQVARTLGATHTINYKTNPQWSEEVLKLTDGKGVDHVLDVGGPGTFQQSLKSTRIGGMVTMMGALSHKQDMMDLSHLTMDIVFGAKTIRGIMGSGSTPMFREMLNLYAEKNLHGAVGAEFAFEDTPKAFEMMQKGGAVGKLVIKVEE